MRIKIDLASRSVPAVSGSHCSAEVDGERRGCAVTSGKKEGPPHDAAARYFH
jgi:hypothetical protein